ncbi:hypothetical protein LBMAG42_51530 [Deltaproteobacteria bacterium]|nr:hypothetical protein LBMAG42_51530 [Deltaproteobacteria bacterium]
MKLRIGGELLRAEAVPGGMRVFRDGRELEFACTDLGNGLVRVVGASGTFTVWVNGARAGARGEALSVTRELARGAGASTGTLSPPMPATVGRVLVVEGERVATGQALVVLVAMKTEITLRAPYEGRVVGLRATIGQNVRPGDRLVQVERDETR